MYATYHLESVDELDQDLLDSIKTAFNSGPVSITIQKEWSEDELSAEQKAILDERLLEDRSDYITAEEHLLQIKSKYGL